jgi:hypothetical protein
MCLNISCLRRVLIDVNRFLKGRYNFHEAGSCDGLVQESSLQTAPLLILHHTNMGGWASFPRRRKGLGVIIHIYCVLTSS